MSHYDALGVPKNADAAAIKRAYRRKSREHHPDRPGGDHKAMVAINRAFETLSNPEKRARYDQFGDDRPGPPPLDALARTIIMNIFLQLLERASDHDDIIKMTREQIQANKREIPGIAEQTKHKIAKPKKRRKRLKYRGKEGNFIDDLLGQQIALLEDQVAKVNERIKVGDRAIELLKDFEYEVERMVKPATAEETDAYTVFKVFTEFGR